tara:strand:- start:178 stop:390 length:213 start_codon:yes stop_codon:yes gene_type:complete
MSNIINTIMQLKNDDVRLHITEDEAELKVILAGFNPCMYEYKGIKLYPDGSIADKYQNKQSGHMEVLKRS